MVQQLKQMPMAMGGSQWLTFTKELKEHLTHRAAQQHKHMRRVRVNRGSGGM